MLENAPGPKVEGTTGNAVFGPRRDPGCGDELFRSLLMVVLHNAKTNSPLGRAKALRKLGALDAVKNMDDLRAIGTAVGEQIRDRPFDSYVGVTE